MTLSVGDLQTGKRYLHGKNHQPLTLCYIGHLPPTASEGASSSNQTQIWYGVEYDDPSRGRHSGTFEGIQVFKTRRKGAGAFLKASEGILRPGPSFVQALQDRYGPVLLPSPGNRKPGVSDTTATEVIEGDGKFGSGSGKRENQQVVLGSSRGNILVEAPGMEDVQRRVSQLERLKEIGLEGVWISGLGAEKEVTVLLREKLKGVRVLNLSRNLLSSWQDVDTIVSCCIGLKILVLNESRIPRPKYETPLVALQGISELHLGQCGMTWAEVLGLSTYMPKLDTLHLNDNDLLVELDDPQAEILPDLRSLSLEGCPIPRWKNLLPGLVRIPALTLLNISSVPIATIPKSNTEYPTLTQLILYNTSLEHWSDIHNLSQYFPNLQSLRISLSPSTFSAAHDHSQISGNEQDPSTMSGNAQDHFKIPGDAQGVPKKLGDGQDHSRMSGDDRSDRPLYIAVFPQLLSLNSTTISASERRDAELFYLSHVDRYLPNKQDWGRYDDLAKTYEHQSVTLQVDKGVVKSGLRSKMITLDIIPCGAYPKPFQLSILPSASITLMIRKISKQISKSNHITVWTCRDPLGGEGQDRQKVADLTEEKGEVGSWFVDGDSVLVDVF
ncbi:hypothetical protein BCR39DRAFT_528683 [Naematelia encephala]|uniref:CAP-Gly domain-containing protein n=1 Tax=Naematelia encephala TaxID=71784 RepID=A0A1Y2B7N5_9TREE|nr:hypothetical protein BCR39DRAFT_528683 [Naematelia encephala]